MSGHGVWHLAGGFLLALAPVIAVRHLGGATAWVVIAQSGTAGMLIGVYAAGRLPVRRPLAAVALGAAVYALPPAALGLVAPLPVVAVTFVRAYEPDRVPSAAPILAASQASDRG